LKPAPFAYHAPRACQEVDALLDELGAEAKVLAGGQSLVPILNMRLAEPRHLVDINGVDDLAAEPAAVGDAVVLGARVRQAVAERSEGVGASSPPLRAALRLVAHPVIRTRGTVVGSVAHADPAAELPALLLAVDGEVIARGRRGRRTIPAQDFFQGPFETALAAGEWLEAVRFPLLSGRECVVDEIARRHGDYAICGVVAVAQAGNGTEIQLALTYFGVADTPVRVRLPAMEPNGLEALSTAVHDAVDDALEPPTDIHATRELRLRLAIHVGSRAAHRAAKALMT
jgi:carbon-monoxide dehydrogenase medium subunit